MELVREIIQQAIAVDSIWSVALRGGIWLLISLVIIISVDKPDNKKSLKDLKSNLGFFLMFIILSSGLLYLLFGFTSVPS